MKDNTILKLDKLSFGYSNKEILNNISLDFKEGEFVHLLGANGSGKSTLFNIILGFLDPNLGVVSIDDKNIKNYTIKERARIISYVSQVKNPIFAFTVEEFLEMANYSKNTSENDEISVNYALNMFDLQKFKHRKITNLSGGELQRVYIARAILQNTKIIILDEPLNNLDMKYQINILHNLRKLCEENNRLVLMSIHDINLSRLYSTRRIYLNQGKFSEESSEFIPQLNDVYETSFRVIEEQDKLVIPEKI